MGLGTSRTWAALGTSSSSSYPGTAVPINRYDHVQRSLATGFFCYFLKNRWGSEELRSYLLLRKVPLCMFECSCGESSDELPVYNAASPSSEVILISRMILISGMSLISICKLLFSTSISISISLRKLRRVLLCPRHEPTRRSAVGRCEKENDISILWSANRLQPGRRAGARPARPTWGDEQHGASPCMGHIKHRCG